MTDRIRLPAPPEAPEKPGFPLLASAAPVVGALAMWAFTQSPYMLLFAFLGPLVALGGLIDSRRRHRKTIRTNQQRHSTQLADTRNRITAAHDGERRTLQRDAAGALDILSHQQPTHERWRQHTDQPITVVLGTGTTPSSIAVDTPHDHNDVNELADLAATLTDAPILADAHDGIGITGTAQTATAHLRALTLQLAHALSPGQATLHVHNPRDALSSGDLEWLHALPHARATQPSSEPAHGGNHTALHFTAADGNPLTTLALAAHESDLPRECRTVIRVTGTTAHIERWPHPDTAPSGVRPHLLTREAATTLANQLRSRAIRDGLLDNHEIPTRVTTADLPEQPPATPDSLACVFGLGPGRAPITVDLVTDGPHALIGGTTGSGKSELLCAWIHTLTATRTPRDLTVLLIDYKGGASFRTIDTLPHIVGTITDLDPTEARRALDSLTAETRHRERQLAQHGARDITELEPGTLPRLVIVIDEYAALAAEHPTLHTLIADIAARGRSLGMHLILATQRPAGIIRDNTLANTPLRISLRVLDPTDSTATIGTPDAAHLPASTPGRAIITTPTRPATPLQPAHITPADAATTRHHPDPTEPPPRRPWQPPLPDTATWADLDAAPADDPGLRFALTDRPTEQRYTTATLNLDTTGNLLIVGSRGSGRTTALRTLAASAREHGLDTVHIPSDIEGAWDTIHTLLDDTRSAHPTPRLCLLDDLDLVLSRTPDDHRDTLTRTLAALLAEGPARGTHTALTTARINSTLSTPASHCDARIVLRVTDRHDHQTAGADPHQHNPHLPPGRGWYRGDLIHIVTTDTQQPTPAATPTPALPLDTGLIVSTRPAELAARLSDVWGSESIRLLTASTPTTTDPHAPTTTSALTTTTGERHRVLIADPDTWLAHHRLFAELSRTRPTGYHACTTTQYRQLSGDRTLPPPLATPHDTLWLAHPSSTTERATIPSVATPKNEAKTMEFE